MRHINRRTALTTLLTMIVAVGCITAADAAAAARRRGQLTGATVLLVGLTSAIVDRARAELGLPGLTIRTATNIEEVRRELSATHIDHVIVGAGLPLQNRLDIACEIFQNSDSTTVHLKDRASGSEGFLTFARAIVHGLRGRSGDH